MLGYRLFVAGERLSPLCAAVIAPTCQAAFILFRAQSANELQLSLLSWGKRELDVIPSNHLTFSRPEVLTMVLNLVSEELDLRVATMQNKTLDRTKTKV